METTDNPLRTTPKPWTTRVSSAASNSAAGMPSAVQKKQDSMGWVGEHAVAISSLLQLAGQGCYVMSGKQFDSWPRSTAAYIHAGGVMLGTVYGQHPQETDNEKATIGQRLMQAFDPKRHIRQTIGVTTMLAAGFSLYSGIRTRHYGEMIGGLGGIAGGGLLTFTKSNAKAWERMGVLSLAALTPAGFYHAYEAKDPWIFAGEILQTLSDAVDVFFISKVAEERARQQSTQAHVA